MLYGHSSPWATLAQLPVVSTENIDASAPSMVNEPRLNGAEPLEIGTRPRSPACPRSLSGR